MTNRWTRLVPLLWLMPFGFARAEMRTVWQIGTFDHSPLEFSSESQDQITFEIGKSEPQKQWSSFQRVGHTYRIVFSLDSARGLYSLKIGALIVQPRPVEDGTIRLSFNPFQVQTVRVVTKP
jgi:Polysaccharide lyase family 4, domain III